MDRCICASVYVRVCASVCICNLRAHTTEEMVTGQTIVFIKRAPKLSYPSSPCRLYGANLKRKTFRINEKNVC